MTSCWAASIVLAQAPQYRDRHYDDGHSASAHASALTAYLREYLRERGRKGMTIEVDSPSYAITKMRFVQSTWDSGGVTVQAAAVLLLLVYLHSQLHQHWAMTAVYRLTTLMPVAAVVAVRVAQAVM